MFDGTKSLVYCLYLENASTVDLFQKFYGPQFSFYSTIAIACTTSLLALLN